MMTDALKDVYRTQSALMKDHYERALEAKKTGIPIIYVTAMFPVEIVKAFEPDVFTVYPENHSVSLIVRGQGEKLAHEAEILGVDRMGCAYELINTGYLSKGYGKLDTEELLDAKQRPSPKLPEPDVLLACDNQCRIICEWFKHISEIFGNVPYKMVNVGEHLDGHLKTKQIEWVEGQLKDTIALLEEVSGKKLDRDRLLEVARP